MAYGDPPGSLIPYFSNRPGPESDLSVAHIDRMREEMRKVFIAMVENGIGFGMGGPVRPVPPMATFKGVAFYPDDATKKLAEIYSIETIAEIVVEKSSDARDKLLSLVRAPDNTYIHTDERYDVWNGGSPLVVILGNTRKGLSLMLADYGTDDHLEVVKRFSDPEFRKAYKLEKSGAEAAVDALANYDEARDADPMAAVREIARST